MTTSHSKPVTRMTVGEMTDRLLSFLRTVPSGKWIKAKDIKRDIGLTARQVRTVVSRQRLIYGTVIASGNRGYKIAETADDLVEAIDAISSKAANEMRIVSNLVRKFNELGGETPPGDEVPAEQTVLSL